MLLDEAEVQESRSLVDCDSPALLGFVVVPDPHPRVQLDGLYVVAQLFLPLGFHCSLSPSTYEAKIMGAGERRSGSISQRDERARTIPQPSHRNFLLLRRPLDHTVLCTQQLSTHVVFAVFAEQGVDVGQVGGAKGAVVPPLQGKPHAHSGDGVVRHG